MATTKYVSKIKNGTEIINIKDAEARTSLSSKVDKVDGKGLSTNDFTTALKNKLDGIASGATANTGTVTKVSAGTGLSGGDITTTGTISLATSGVTAGTYKRVTVDAYGRVTAGDNTDNNTTYTFAGGTNKFTVTPSGGSAQDVTVTPSISNNVTANGNFAANAIVVGNAANQVAKNSGVTISTAAPSSSSADTTVPTSKAVWSAIDALPEPMVFKGSLGTGGTITALPVNGTATIGDTYKVITAGTYANQAAKIGDVFICSAKTSSSNSWTYIPSADEPSGTVTSVKIAAGTGLSVDDANAITTSGTRTISLSSASQTSLGKADTAIQTITAAAGSNIGSVGTPSVTASTSNNATTLTFNYLKGAKGDKGDKGDAGSNGTTPTIKAAAGSNIGSVGTPSVSASTSGTTTTFTFNYLKGAKGDPGQNATTTAVVSTSANGLAPKVTDTSKFLKGDGTWATPTNTDESVKVNNITSTSDSTYYIATANAINGTAQSLNGINSFYLRGFVGTTSKDGSAILYIGNATATGTAGNSKGGIRLFGNNTGYAQIVYTDSTANSTQTFPTTSGTILNSGTSSVSKSGETLTVKINGTEKSLTNTTYSEATTSTAGLMSAADKTKLNGIAAGAEVNVQSDWNAESGDAFIKNKPQIGVAGGIASLDSTGKVPSSQLPSYVDDVIEGYYHDNKFYATYTPGEEEQEGTYSDEIMPELGKIYVDIPTNQSYRWSGSTYIVISSPYVLPTASANTLGGVKVGDGLSIDNNGVLSAEGQEDVYTRAQVDAKVADTVHLSAQTLTEAQKAQARDNIGVVGSGFQVTTDETTGTDVFTALGTAIITHDDTTGADVFSF